MKSSGSNSSSNGGGEGCCSKMERKTIEKQRRMQMKNLCMKLSSLIPKQHISSHSSKDALTQLDNLEEAASYIINLRNKIEKLKERREQPYESKMQSGKTDDFIGTSTSTSRRGIDNKLLRLPIMEVRYQHGNLEVVLIVNSSTCAKLTFHKVIRIIEEEGVDIVNASHSTIADKLVYTIHSKVRNPRSGLEAERVSSRLKEWI